MLIESLLVGTITGLIGYTCKILYETDKTKEIEVNNIIKYEYIPSESIEDTKIILDKIKYTFVEGEKEGIRACIGYDIEGKEIIIDILDGHLLIGGMTGGGKSN